jgi:RNA polymerase sigma-70 factor (ECF subfamily)
MVPPDSPGSPDTPWSGRESFVATRWSIILTAADRRTSVVRRRALAELIQVYWLPVYAYVRRQGREPADAEDLTQDFFTRLLEKRTLASVDREKGRFRSFLLASVKHFLANEWHKSRTRKRGGGCRPLALDGLDAEARYRLEPADDMTPERHFERRCALAVLEEVLDRLAKEYEERGSGALFEALRGGLEGEEETPTYAESAAKLGMSEGALKVAAHRLRKRYRELLREEIAQTVASPDLVDEEIRYLMECL